MKTVVQPPLLPFSVRQLQRTPLSPFSPRVQLSPGLDFNLSDNLTINSGNTSTSITLSTINDNLTEGDETFVVEISTVFGGDNASENGTQQLSFTIIDDDNTSASDPSTNLSTLLSTNACEGCNLSGIQLNGDNLTGGSKFTGADLDHANLANATLKNLTFVGAQFYQANLDNATLDRVELEQANLGSNSLSFTTMINSQILKTNINQASGNYLALIHSFFDNVSFSANQLTHTNFDNTSFLNSSFYQTNLDNSTFVGTGFYNTSAWITSL